MTKEEGGSMKTNSTGVLICVTAVIIGALLIATVSRAAGTQKAEKTDLQRLEGRWLRPDGGYVLELRDTRKDGSVTAVYFNPRSINVAKAVLSRTDGKINLFVELRDINYPGSTYNLQYDPKTDQLKGTYFQAIQRQTFDVEFVRVK